MIIFKWLWYIFKISVSQSIILFMSRLAHFTNAVMHEIPLPMGTLTSWLGVLFALVALILLFGLFFFWRGRNSYVIGVPPDPLSRTCYGPDDANALGVSGMVPIGVVNTAYKNPGFVSVGY